MIKLVERYPVKFGYLFGSIVKDLEGPLSDIDIALYLDAEITNYQRHQYRLELLASLNEIFTQKSIDLIILNHVTISLAYHIIKEGVLFCNYASNEKERVEEEIILRYLDYRLFAEKFNEWQSKVILESDSYD
ncbi:MAG: nucleotidyltransferase domain-containing protein [Promethearchaeota archaeon]